MAGEVRQREQQVADLLFPLAGFSCERRLQLIEFLAHLAENLPRPRPVEADPGGATAEFVGAFERRQTAADVVEQ